MVESRLSCNHWRTWFLDLGLGSGKSGKHIENDRIRLVEISVGLIIEEIWANWRCDTWNDAGLTHQLHFGLSLGFFVRYGEALGTVVQLCLPNEFCYLIFRF